MTPTVKAEKIEGLSVYGLPQYEYTLEGTAGRFQFCSVVTEASFKQAVAVEDQILSVAAVLKARRRKLEDFGKALSIFAKLIPHLNVKEQKSTDTVKVDWEKGGKTDGKDYYDFFGRLNAIYGLEIKFEKGPEQKEGKPPPPPEEWYFSISREALQKGQAQLEDAVDRDDNGMQQEMTTLDGYVAKRDKSFATAEKVVKKYNSAADNTIKAMA